MTKKLNKKIKKSNKIVEKTLFGNLEEVYFSPYLDEKYVYFEAVDSLTGAITAGSYYFNKKGHVTSFTLSTGDSEGLDFTYAFELENKKSFRKSAEHLRRIFDVDTTFASILSDSASTGDCQDIADYLTVLSGVDYGSDESIGAAVGYGDLCYA